MQGSNERIRVLLALRHPLLMRGILDFLSEQPDLRVVAECGDGLEALASARSLAPDVCIVDLHLPRLGAPEFIRAAHAQGLRTKTLVLANVATQDVAESLRLDGGEGLCSKDIEPQALLESIIRLARGGTCFPSFRFGSTVAPRDQGWKVLASGHELTRREAQIAAYVSAGLASKEVARRLHLSEGTVKVHLSNIYRKIGVGNRTALAYALRHLEQEPPRNLSMATGVAG